MWFTHDESKRVFLSDPTPKDLFVAFGGREVTKNEIENNIKRLKRLYSDIFFNITSHNSESVEKQNYF
jgi:hypothetical protein